MILECNISLKHPLLEFVVGHVMVGVNPCGRCLVVALLPHITNLPKQSQNNGFKVCELIRVSILPLSCNEGYMWSFGDDTSGGSNKKPTTT